MRGMQRSKAGSLIALLVLLTLPGCGSDDGDDGTEPPTTGSLRATATLDGSPLSGASVSLFEAGGTNPSSTRTTGSDGGVTFTELDPGSWDVEITPPTGSSLSTGQEARVSANVTAGQTAQVEFSLESAGEVVEVALTSDLRFSPSVVTISPGTTVRWVNESNVSHTVTPDEHSEWSSASLTEQGQTFTHTFEEAGDFDYYCEPHLSAGMTGTVVVQ